MLVIVAVASMRVSTIRQREQISARKESAEWGGCENKTTTHSRSFLAQRRNWPMKCTQSRESIGLAAMMAVAKAEEVV